MKRTRLIASAAGLAAAAAVAFPAAASAADQPDTDGNGRALPGSSLAVLCAHRTIGDVPAPLRERVSRDLSESHQSFDGARRSCHRRHHHDPSTTTTTVTGSATTVVVPGAPVVIEVPVGGVNTGGE